MENGKKFERVKCKVEILQRCHVEEDTSRIGVYHNIEDDYIALIDSDYYGGSYSRGSSVTGKTRAELKANIIKALDDVLGMDKEDNKKTNVIIEYLK